MIRSSAQQQGKVVVWGQRARTLVLCVLAVLVAASSGLLLGVGPAHAETFTVNSTGDARDNNIGNGSCFTGIFVQVGRGFEAECTLRAAIQEANVNDQSDTINFLSGLSGTITLSLGELTIADDTSATTEDLIIQGPGARTMTVSGNDASRVFYVDSLTNVTISGLTISDGNSGDGGGIYNGGTLELTNSTVSNNAAYRGGGIFNLGTLTLTNSTVSSNAAADHGGGILNPFGTVKLTNSTVSDNTADEGGGIYNAGGNSLTLTNSTVSSNAASNGLGYGGGIYNAGRTVTLTNTTVSSNAAHKGGGIYNARGTVTLTNTTVSHNSADAHEGFFIGGGILTTTSDATTYLRNTIIARNIGPLNPDVAGRYYSQGNNLIGNTSGSSGWVTSDLKNVDPLLGPLQDNGGPTKTHALLVGSPALNAIPSGTNGCGTTITTDQRGVNRPQSGGCEIGSFEDESPKVTSVFPQDGATAIAPAANISAIFSEAMRAASINTDTVKLYKVGEDGALAATVTYGGLARKAMLDPSGTLVRGAKYKAVVTTGAKDVLGNRLDQDPMLSGNQQKVWFFTVRN